MSRIRINEDQTRDIGKCIKGTQFKASYVNRPFVTYSAKAEWKSNAYMMASAVCHQTHNLRNETSNLIGWNYIEHVFRGLAEDNNPFLDFNNLNVMSAEEIGYILASFFPLNSESIESTLDNPFERGMLIKDLVTYVVGLGNGSSYEFVQDQAGQSLENLYDGLSKMQAFSDPYRKKSTLYIKLMHQSGLIELDDIMSVNPLMDYHMQRLLLRTGCVEILDEELSRKLKNRDALASDSDVRKACIDAIVKISSASGISILDLDDLFWAIGRSCCNKEILCSSGKCDKSPCTFTTIVDDPKHVSCILQEGCRGYKTASLKDYWEPNVTTEYY